MSQQEQTQPTEQPQEVQSEADIIRQELRQYIEQGNNLQVKDIRVAVCKEIAAKLNKPYKNVSAQVGRVLKEAVHDGLTNKKHTVDTGSGRVDVEVPPPVPKEPEPQPEAPKQPQQPPAPIFDSLEDLLNSRQFKQANLEFGLIFHGLDRVMEAVGIPMASAMAEKVIKEQHDALVQQWAVYAVKNNLQFPKYLELAALGIGTFAMYGIPLLGKLGFIGDKKDKKQDPPRSDKPL